MSDDSDTLHAPVASFFDERIDMAYWLPKIRELDVPVPESHPVPLEYQDEGPPEWDDEHAVEIVEDLGGEAFARSGYKSAQMHLDGGSHVRSADIGEVSGTLTELAAQHAMMEMPMGESLWLREYLDLNFCAYHRENLVPEVRAFIRDGEVVCHHPRLEGFDRAPDGHREAAEELIDTAWPAGPEDGLQDHGRLEPYAQRVAQAFDGDGWWSVDFVMERGGGWWLTDMALDALYSMERRGEEGYTGISEHPGDCPNDVEREGSA